ncbi:MAG: T9SS type A sorting domain-containing protein [Fibrobacteres bacterium]|nr:T9SS type A sorting domain-containing protein [Fibrobacterota bacterium]
MKKMVTLIAVLCGSVFSQLDTAALPDNQWFQIMDENMTINQGNWVYENDFKGDPNSSLFILGPGHVIHPQDCYYYPYDVLQNKWYKVHSTSRPTRQCLSSFAVNGQDSMILQMAGSEMGHQQSQGGFDDLYSTIIMGRKRGSVLWAYSMSRNHWAFMGGPTTFNQTDFTIMPQYDPVHDIMLSVKSGTISAYSYHLNRSVQYPSPVLVAQYAYSVTVDTRRGLFYILNNTGMYAFNPDSGKGVKVADAGPGYHDASDGSNGPSLNLMDYDEANDVIIYVFDGLNGNMSYAANAQTWAFKCDSLKWQRITPIASPPDRGRLAYNRHLNLFMMAGGKSTAGVISRGGGTNTSWVYRYKRTQRQMDALAAAPVASISNSSAGAALSWTSVAGASGYNIYRAACTGSIPRNFQKLNSSPVSALTYTDNSGSAGAVYSYKVVAVKDGAEGQFSRHCYTVPGVITDLAASVEESTVVRVSWVPRPEADIAGYNVYRARGSSMHQATMAGNYTKLNATPLTATEYWDTMAVTGNNLKDRVARGYIVKAVNNAGLEAGPSIIATTFPDSPEWAYTVPTSGKFRMGWQSPRRTKVLGVNMYRIQGAKVNPTLITDTVTYNWDWPPATATDAFSIQGQTYVIRAVNMLGQEGFATDQISPSISTFGFGMVTPTSSRFKYSLYTGVAAEKGSLSNGLTQNKSMLSLSPNPFNPSVKMTLNLQAAQKIEIEIFNQAGRLIEKRSLSASRGESSHLFNLSGKPTGLYLFRVKADTRTESKVAMLIK